MKSREIAIAGLLIALQLTTLLLVFIIPTIKLSLLVAVSLYSGVLLRVGVNNKTILISYITTSILSVFMLISVPQILIAYIAFFGSYSLIHEISKNMPLVKKQLIRWGAFIVSMTIMYIIINFIVPIELNYALSLIAVIAVVAFIIYQLFYEFIIKEFIKMTKMKYIGGKITFRK